MSLNRCVRGLEFGHTARKWTYDYCRTRRAENVGANHILRECKAHPKCMLHKGKKGAVCRHVLDSSRCTVFKRTMGGIKKWGL